MDFSLTEEQEAIRDLARQIFSDRATHERLLQLEQAKTWFDDELWQEIGNAGLPGVAVSEEFGGSGFGFSELCLVLEEVGRHVAPVPLFATAVLGALPVGEFGSDAQRRELLPKVASGELILTAALAEVGSSDPARPRVTATRDGAGWRLDGEKVCVSAAQRAGRILVPARTGDASVGVFLLDPRTDGVTLEQQIATHREPQGRLQLSGAFVPDSDVLGDPSGGAAIVRWITERARVALAAMQIGVADAAMRQTAEYISNRKQFGRPIATFQGVALRIADAFIDVDGIRSTVWQAAWRLSAGLPSGAEVATAKWWACRAGERVVHTAQHLHGGIGADIEYPIHRYFLWSKYIDNTLGGASQQLAEIGALIARGEVRAES